jgi:hypothetical protein
MERGGVVSFVTIAVSTRSVLLGLVAVVAGAGSAAAQAPSPAKMVGAVTAADPSAGTFTVQPDGGGPAVKVETGANTQYRKAMPGATSLEGMATVAIGDVKVGDRILAIGARSGDGATLTARQIVVMAQSDIADKQQRERADWQRRGAAGVITALDPAKQEITVQTRAGGSPQSVVIATAEKKAAFKRYAPDSIKFSDAKPSAFTELVVGDQVRALGDRSEDGLRLTAEQIVSGAFRTVVGAVEEVDTAKNEIRIADASSKGKLTVAIGADTLLRRLPPEMAARMGARRPGAEGGPAEPREGGPAARTGGGAPGAPGAGGGPGGERGRGGAPNLGDLLERLPTLALSELKAGDRIAISSTRGTDATKVTAIALVAGIEPLLAAPDNGARRQGGLDLMPGLPGGALDMGMGGGF